MLAAAEPKGGHWEGVLTRTVGLRLLGGIAILTERGKDTLQNVSGITDGGGPG